MAEGSLRKRKPVRIKPGSDSCLKSSYSRYELSWISIATADPGDSCPYSEYLRTGIARNATRRKKPTATYAPARNTISKIRSLWPGGNQEGKARHSSMERNYDLHQEVKNRFEEELD